MVCKCLFLCRPEREINFDNVLCTVFSEYSGAGKSNAIMNVTTNTSSMNTTDSKVRIPSKLNVNSGKLKLQANNKVQASKNAYKLQVSKNVPNLENGKNFLDHEYQGPHNSANYKVSCIFLSTKKVIREILIV
jgi:hypothetical protein